MPDRSKQISELCKKMFDEIMTDEGGVSIAQGRLQALSLCENGIFPHQLNSPELITLIEGLMRSLFTKANSSISLPDHNLLIRWMAELLLLNDHKIFGEGQEHLQEMLKVYLPQFLFNEHRDGASKYYYDFPKDVPLEAAWDAELCDRATGFTSLALPFLVFPLLDGCLTYLSREYVSSDGIVLKPFYGDPGLDASRKRTQYDPNKSGKNAVAI